MRRTAMIALGWIAALWIAYTLYSVMRFGGAVVVDPETTSRIMAVRNDDQLHTAIGLTYRGITGAVLVIAELAIVIAALAAGVLGAGWKRRCGRFVLATWSVLWLGNALWLQSKGWDRVTDLAIIAGGTAAVVLWAGLSIGPPRARPGGAGGRD